MPDIYAQLSDDLFADRTGSRSFGRRGRNQRARAEREALRANEPPEIREQRARIEELREQMDALYRTGGQSYNSPEYWRLEEQFNQLNRERSNLQYAVDQWEERERVRPRGALISCDTCYDQSYENDGRHSVRRDGTRNPTCRRCVRLRRAAVRSVRENGRKFGIEIEFVSTEERENEWGETYRNLMDPDDIVAALNDAGLNAYNAGYSHSVSNEWKLVPDSSVDEGWELVSPPLTWEQRDQVHTACRTLQDLGCDVSAQCGLHVHHEVRDLSLNQFKRLVRLWDDTQSLTNSLVDHSRTGRCEWCSPFQAREVERLTACDTYGEFRNQMDNQDRYRSLNLTAFASYGTVEVRQHQGTLDSNKILAWVQYGQTIIDAAKLRRRPKRDHVHSFLDALPFKCSRSRDYLKQTARVPVLPQLALRI